MRWVALGVDYEMSGKDLIESTRHSSAICRALGGRPPAGFNYELFLDKNGEKISKSRGNGLSIDEWLAYGTQESLALYNFHKPKTAKRLFFDVIPKAVDDYLAHVGAYERQDTAAWLENPVWHIHEGAPPSESSPVSFNLLLNLAAAAGSGDRTVLWGFISNYVPEASPESHPLLDRLAGHAAKYYEDFIRPSQKRRAPNDRERAALEDLVSRLKALDPGEKDAETIQTEVYAAGKAHSIEPLRDWFRGLYEVLFGQSQGPRFGSFVAIYGVSETVMMIENALQN